MTSSNEHSMSRPPIARVLQGALILVAALAGDALPLVTYEASNPRFTDIEARIGFGAGAILVNTLFGARAGWAVGAPIPHFWEHRR